MSAEAAWVECFTLAHDQSHGERSRQAFDYIGQVLAEHPDVLLDASSRIVADSGHPAAARRMAALALARSLRASGAAHLADLRRRWAQSPALAAQARAAAHAALLCDDAVVRGAAAQALALVVALERDAGALRAVCEALPRALGCPAQAAALLSVFSEVLALECLCDLRAAPLCECYAALFAQAVDLLGGAGVELALRRAAAAAVRDAAAALPELCAGDAARVRAVLRALPAALAPLDEFLFAACHRTMLNLVRAHYAAADGFADLLFPLALGALEMAAPAHARFRAVGIVFWKELAALELEIALRGDGRPEKLAARAAPAVIPVLFDIMARVDPADTAIENPDEQTCATHAAVAVQAFFNAMPRVVFDNWLRPTFERCIASDDWTLRHAAVLLLNCMCPLDDGMPVQAFDDGVVFIGQQMPQVLAACLCQSVPRLVETALYVLAEILHNYPVVITRHRFCLDPALAIRQIMELFVLGDNTHPVIISRYCLVLYFLVGAWVEDRNMTKSPLPQFYGSFMSFLRQIMGRCQGIAELMELYSDAAETLNRVIHVAMDSSATVDEMRALFAQTLDDLEATRHGPEMDGVRFIMQALLCSNLSFLAMSLRHMNRDNDVHRAIFLLLELLRLPHQLLYEEALFSLTGLYRAASHVFEGDDILTILSIIQFALTSESPGVIIAASGLLGELFKSAGPALVDHFMTFLDLEEELLRSHEPMRDIHASIVKAITEMLEGLDTDEQYLSVLSPLKRRIFALMQLLRGVALDVTKKEDLTYANELFESLIQLYRIFAKLYYPDTKTITSHEAFAQERAILVEMSALATALKRLNNKIHENVLLEFILMVQIYATFCSRKNNIILNRSSVHDVLKLAKGERYHNKVRKLGKETLASLLVI
jgi:hypothetical protein